jgi:signal transduction histidine kinase
MTRTRRFLTDNVETIVFASALLVIATLLVWWGVFSRGLIVEHTALQARYASTPAEQQQFEDKGDRQLAMIAGEGSMFAIALVACTGALFYVAVRRRESKNRLERLLQFTTHELKTPIAGVRALLQSMQIGSIPESERGRFLDQGLAETNRLEHLVETILAYQRAATRMSTAPLEVDSADLVADVLAHRSVTFGDEKLTRVPADIVLHARVLADKDAFRVVLENLLDNARKYGGGGPVTLSERLEGGQYRLAVSDQGMGFDPGDGEKLFDPFTRKDGSAGIHGSGLGLYISRQLVREMGGELAATSEGKGKGATFTLTMKAVAADTPAPGGAHG